MESTLQVNLKITTTEVIQRWFINDILVDSFCFSVLYSNLIKKNLKIDQSLQVRFTCRSYQPQKHWEPPNSWYILNWGLQKDEI